MIVALDTIVEAPPRKLTNAENLRRLRQEAVAKGLCYQCRCRPVKPSTRYCVECVANNRDYDNRRRKQRARSGLCTECGTILVDTKYKRCDACNREDSEALARRILSGKCASCRNDQVPGHTLCQECLDYQKAYEKQRREKRRAAGLCPICASRRAKPVPGRTMCRACLKRLRVASKLRTKKQGAS